jgi:glutamate racemase
MHDDRPIGVFDSGVGGLTVVRALLTRLPHENIVYFGDTARVPYGPKSPQVVREYAAQDTDVLLGHNVKLIVIACNTVSALALDVVQKRSRIPVVGVILPGAESAVAASRNKRIGVIGTAGTIKSQAYVHAIRQSDPAAHVFGRACPLFVPLVEEGWIDHQVTKLVAKEYLFPLLLEKIDTLVLGCTHYPLLAPTLGAVLQNTVTLIDSGQAAAEVVAVELQKHSLSNSSTEKPRLQFLVSDLPDKFGDIGERFLGRTLGRVSRISL